MPRNSLATLTTSFRLRWASSLRASCIRLPARRIRSMRSRNFAEGRPISCSEAKTHSPRQLPADSSRASRSRSILGSWSKSAGERFAARRTRRIGRVWLSMALASAIS